MSKTNSSASPKDFGLVGGYRNPLKGHVTKMNASNCSSEGMAHDEAFPVLNAAEIHVAEKFGRRERLEAGRVLFEPGSS
jgi:hypothetical protein